MRADSALFCEFISRLNTSVIIRYELLDFVTVSAECLKDRIPAVRLKDSLKLIRGIPAMPLTVFEFT